MIKNTFGFGFPFASERRSAEFSGTAADDAPTLPVRFHAPDHHQPHPASFPLTADHHPAAPVVAAAVGDRDRSEVKNVGKRANTSKRVHLFYLSEVALLERITAAGGSHEE